ncbi:MAG: hypothetical protein JJ958_06595 [Balneola sp.]|nr:hypothetical protein [Balneola sp.]
MEGTQENIKIALDAVDLNKLKPLLRYGDIKKIAEKTGFSRGYIHNCLNPRNPRENSNVVNAAIDLVDERNTKSVSKLTAESITKSA